VPGSTNNYDVLLEAVHDSKTGIVHIQYEQGLYRLVLDLINCDKTPANIDSFYHDCKVQLSPLVVHTSNSKSVPDST
jgi:hypothetical protein